MTKVLTIAGVILTTTVLVFLSSCESEEATYIDQRRIYTEYELFYNANIDSTYAKATFTFGNATGSLVKLRNGGSITFNGDTLIFNKLFAIYQKEYAGFIPEGTFKYTDLDGNTYINDIEIHEIAYPDMIDNIVKGEDYDFKFEGDPLTTNEKVVVRIEGPLEGTLDDISAWNDDIGDTSVKIISKYSGDLTVGENKAWMERSYFPDLQQQTDVGGMITGRYRPVDTTVQIVE